jgi:sRNA-binding protein
MGRNSAIIKLLVQRFPFGFSLEPKLIVPLSTNAFSEIVRVLRLQESELYEYRQALIHYQRSTAYLRALALGRRRRTLWGDAYSQPITPIDREEARSELLRRGRWSEKLEQVYRSKLGLWVKLEPTEKRRKAHELRKARWMAYLHTAGFSDEEIALIERHGINTKDLTETKSALKKLCGA